MMFAEKQFLRDTFAAMRVYSRHYSVSLPANPIFSKEDDLFRDYEVFPVVELATHHLIETMGFTPNDAAKAGRDAMNYFLALEHNDGVPAATTAVRSFAICVAEIIGEGVK